jgi:hypothetical protein
LANQHVACLGEDKALPKVDIGFSKKLQQLKSCGVHAVAASGNA